MDEKTTTRGNEISAEGFASPPDPDNRYRVDGKSEQVVRVNTGVGRRDDDAKP